MPTKQTTAGRQARAATRESQTSLEHRRLLDHPPGFRPFRGTGLFDRLGGRPTVDRLVDLLYDGFDCDEQLRPLFPPDLADGRTMQKLFFAEWLGGPRRYSESSHAGLRHRHDSLPITRGLAGRWLGHFRRALDATVADEDDRQLIFAQVRSLALLLVNGQAAPGRPTSRRNGGGDVGGSSVAGPRQVAWCGIGGRTVKQAMVLAHRGDTAGLDAALAEAPDLLGPTYSAAIMQAAALAGRTPVVRMLLDHGIGANHPFYLPIGVTGAAFERVLFVTPLCAARTKGRTAVEALLVSAGAREDVFTAAYLGDLPVLATLLAAEPTLALAADPAVDVLDLTPVDHAVAGGQVEALRLLLDHSEGPPATCVRALRGAAARGSVAMVEVLLAHGADATRIGVGRWVLHPELAPLLSDRGASVDSSGAWIGHCCTGNQGRKDDPAYVRALLRHGARADDRRTGDAGNSSGVAALDATALHYAAKAGFLQTIEVLLEHGADPHAHDSRGRSPLDWVDEAAPSVPRDAVRRVLTTERTPR